jgi:hypothetical protein
MSDDTRISTPSFTTGQQSLTGTAAQIVAQNDRRARVTITNLGTNDTYLGASNVTTSTGDLLVGIKGAKMVIYSKAAIYGVVASSGSVSYMEETV